LLSHARYARLSAAPHLRQREGAVRRVFTTDETVIACAIKNMISDISAWCAMALPYLCHESSDRRNIGH
jgi:hypothetical protein